MVSTRELLYGGLTASALFAVGYMIYFDQRRQRDPEFRKELRRRRLRAEKKYSLSIDQTKSIAVAEGLKAAGLSEDEPVPPTPEGREKYFLKHLQLGEDLMMRGESYFPAAAACFFRGLKVHGNPMQMMMMLQPAVPEPVFNMIMELLAEDMKATDSKGREAADIDQ
ncbi:protein import receptor MAS20 [Cladochytrium replicatum]|nr:protein import receptor MAS20 [Cladochytrium replicatum]